MNRFISTLRSNAVKVGSFCVAVYITNYVARNVLSIVTPFMLEEGLYTKEYLGTLTSVYLALYGAGQLVNGFLGEKIKPALMLFISCLLSGTGLLVFPLTGSAAVHTACFAALGFGLSMMRGPLLKLITGNAPPKTARAVCVVFSTVSFLGPIIVSFFAMVMRWNFVFYTSAGILYAMGAATLLYIGSGMRSGRVMFYPSHEGVFGSLRDLMRVRHAYFYLIVAMIVEIVSIVIAFWAPTYLSEYLSFTPAEAAAIYSAMSLSTVPCYAVAVFLYDRLFKKNDVLMTVVFYAATALCFASLFFTRSTPTVNVAAFALALILNKFVASLLWNIFVPGLAEYGCVSCGNGVYDFTGYISSAAAGVAFSHVVGVSWKLIIVIWTGIAVFGSASAAICLSRDRRRKGAAGEVK